MGGNKKTTKKKFKDGVELKIVVEGQDGVGKSSLIIRFVQGEFPEYYDPTIEDSFRKFTAVDGVKIYFDILDTVDDVDSVVMRESYIIGADLFIFVFSIDNKKSFGVLPERIEQVLFRRDVDKIDAILIGNKIDLELEDERQVSREEAMELAAKYQFPYMETSAKTGDFVEESFFNLIRFANGETIIPQIFNNVKKAR